MGTPATRIGDLCSGHSGYPPRPSTTGSGNVFINGRGAHLKGGSWEKHCIEENDRISCHTGTTVSGSETVRINGIAAVRAGDTISCGSTALSGSSNVYIG